MSEHRGVTYAVPNTDDGRWRWVVYPNRDAEQLARLNAAPRPVYTTRDDAEKAAKIVIDKLLDG
jgi:hypothetical protein